MTDYASHLVEQIDELFAKNNLTGGWIHSCFHDRLKRNNLKDFYVDTRVGFKGKRTLMRLVDELNSVLNSTHTH